MSTPDIGLKQHVNGIAEIILQRPAKHNALTPEMIQALLECLQHCQQDDDIKVVLMRAQGTSFCAGADLQWMADSVDYTLEQNNEDTRQLSELFYTLYHLPQPTIAIVQGNCFGGGIGLVSCCDIGLASNAVNFCFSEVSIGLTPATISPYVIRAIGEANTRRFFLTAEKIDATTAKEIGLVHEVVPQTELATCATRLCEQLLANSPHAMRACKQLIANVSQRPIDKTLAKYTANEIANIRTSEQGQKGMQAFLAKCKISWDA